MRVQSVHPLQVKICGITTPDDALSAVRAGADALGLNFYPRSPRFLAPDRARQIVDALAASEVLKVGLFVNSPADQVRSACDALGLDMVQLHGDEPPEYLSEMKSLRVIRAFRVGPQGLGPVLDYLRRCAALDSMPELVLLDSFVKQAYGGSGQQADWTALAAYPRSGLPPVVLAGGLTPDCVEQAIQTVRPAAVDVASGVETSPGCKSWDLMATFVARARSALAKLA
jgi:phosphoribosylanthranilate isomerase